MAVTVSTWSRDYISGEGVGRVGTGDKRVGLMPIFDYDVGIDSVYAFILASRVFLVGYLAAI